jgi:hypothetical protein
MIPAMRWTQRAMRCSNSCTCDMAADYVTSPRPREACQGFARGMRQPQFGGDAVRLNIPGAEVMGPMSIWNFVRRM